MEMISRFRDKDIVKLLLENIFKETETDKIYNIMEVCGTHTMSISRFGIRGLLPKNVRLISGPGCPVCVTSQGEIDMIFELLKYNDVIAAVYGDLMKVPGSDGRNLLDLKAEGKDIRVVISPLDVLKLKNEQKKGVVFISIGFETTNPATAGLIEVIVNQGLDGFYILTLNKTMPEIIDILLEDKELNVDGFLCPGHVSVMTGESLYLPIIKRNKAAVITGFEPVDILYSILDIIRQINCKNFFIKNNYGRVVNSIGNEKANGLVYKYFEPADSIWRGVGTIKNSGLKIREQYKYLDASERFGLHPSDKLEIDGCKCGEVLKGKILPNKCNLFGLMCTPENPVGPCMVSSEGACAAYYKYEI
ncbi:hydrogenase formation protein HypD [Deferribacterales bacterium Es71-Z0220]|uniref:hydrogenase formation protein HypD n=1 Tax=Deferrivibrio essentukiensis TaxID=2880922 RepID=UPI001F61814B|nr:hydrogenase formation protein HypD [Deferrivibrio essentukiensis]MCB4205082.1 hydrogenase formation protein HypD [Deferrivibrio essentukiensis]